MNVCIIYAFKELEVLENQNTLMLMSKPLIQYTIESSLNSFIFDDIYILTDIPECLSIAKNYNIKILEFEFKKDIFIDDIFKLFYKKENVLLTLLDGFAPMRDEKIIRNSLNKFKCLNSSISIGILKGTEDYETYKLEKNNFNLNKIILNKSIVMLKKDEFNKKDILFNNLDKISNHYINDRIDFEVAIFYKQFLDKKKFFIQQMKKRIEEKSSLFLEEQEITLIGYSIFDYWNIKNICGKKVTNLAIAGINTREYNEWIIKKDILKKIGKYVFILAGTNDVVEENFDRMNTLKEIEYTIKYIKNLRKDVKIYYIEIPPVNNRLDRTNVELRSLNTFLVDNLKDKIKIISIDKVFFDEFNNLDLKYTYDGLHFTEEGYSVLLKLLEKSEER